MSNRNVNELRLAVDPSPFHVDTLGQGRLATDWSRDDRFFVYVGGGRAIATSDLWVAPVASPEEARPMLKVYPRPPVRLDAYPYAVSRDGRFIVNTLLDGPASTVITLILNWTAGAGAQPAGRRQ